MFRKSWTAPDRWSSLVTTVAAHRRASARLQRASTRGAIVRGWSLALSTCFPTIARVMRATIATGSLPRFSALQAQRDTQPEQRKKFSCESASASLIFVARHADQRGFPNDSGIQGSAASRLGMRDFSSRMMRTSRPGVSGGLRFWSRNRATVRGCSARRESFRSARRGPEHGGGLNTDALNHAVSDVCFKSGRKPRSLREFRRVGTIPLRGAAAPTGGVLRCEPRITTMCAA